MSSNLTAPRFDHEITRLKERVSDLERILRTTTTSRPTPTVGAGWDDYVYLYINTPDPTMTGSGTGPIAWNGDVYEVGSGDLAWPYEADIEQVGPLVPGRLYLATASVEISGQAVGDIAQINLQTAGFAADLLGGNPGNRHTKVTLDSTMGDRKLSVAQFLAVADECAAVASVAVETASGATVSTFRELTFSVARIA